MAAPGLRLTIVGQNTCKRCYQCGRLPRVEPRRWQSTASTVQAAAEELEQTSFHEGAPSEETIKSYDPVRQMKERTRKLPPSRYQYRSPRYYRGPLHPHQPPPASDPASREFIPGPFTLTRMQQTYDSTIAQDIMTLAYHHLPPGVQEPPVGQRLRSWEGDSPYFAGRPLRAPKGGHPLRPVHRRITFKNVPAIQKVVVHAFVADASSDSAPLHVAGMVLQSITGHKVVTHQARQAVVQWGLKKGRFTSCTVELTGEDMYHFLAKVVELVMPRVKEYRGVNWSSGDQTGNVSFGFDPESVSLFPEIEFNYDAYPEKMIPGIHVNIQTTAKADKEARLLLTALGIPFYGKFRS